MKVQTTVLLLCFLSGVFVSVVQAKPSPALMRELIALEKYLEKKEGSEGADSQNKNPDEISTDQNENDGQNDGHQKSEQAEENKPTENGEDRPVNENNNNVNGEEGSSADGLKAPPVDKKPTEQSQNIPPEEPEEGVPPAKPEEGVPPAKPEEGVPPAKPEEGVPPAKPEEGVPPNNAEKDSGHSVNGEEAPQEEEGFPASGGEGDIEKPKEGNRPSPSAGQEVKGRDQIFEVLDEATRKIKDALDILITLGDEFRKQFQNDDLKLKELEDKVEQTKEKTKEKLGQLKTAVEDFKTAIIGEDTRSVGKKSVPDNAPARRSHISDTEFLNIVHSLLKNN